MRQSARGADRSALPPTRFALSALLVAAAFVSGPAHAASPTAPIAFEARCAGLPTTSVEIATGRATPQHRFDVPAATLATLGPETVGREHTVGLTKVGLRYGTNLTYFGIEDGARAACVRPRVQVTLTLDPVSIYVAREYHGNPCREAQTLAHEGRHFEVYDRFLDEAPGPLGEALRNALGTDPHFATDARTARDSIAGTVEQVMRHFVSEATRLLLEANARIDSPEEYERLARVCGAGN